MKKIIYIMIMNKNICYLYMILPYSFLQVAGALPFSSFLTNKGGNKKKKKTIKQRTIKKKNLSRKKATKRKNLTHKKQIRDRTNHKKDKTNKKTIKKVKKLKKTKKLTVLNSRKKKTCKCDNSTSYSGNDPSPEGLGYCAHCTPNVTMKGHDGNLWENQQFSNKKKWVKIRIDTH